MRGLVVYESMFGNTRRVAEAITEALSGVMEVRLLRADRSINVDFDAIDLLVVGAPTHAWGMPRPGTRRGALSNLRRPGSDLVLEPDADSRPGVREWLDVIGDVRVMGAVFDTRRRGPSVLTGNASRGIAKSLERRGLVLAVFPGSFLVDRRDHLLPGEAERAREWGLRLGAEVMRRVTAKG